MSAPKEKPVSQNVKVVVRIRPLNKIELREENEEIFITDGPQTVTELTDGDEPGQSFSFDRVFGKEEDTVDLYNYIGVPILESSMMGFNSTIFAYGQTGSGKTWSLMGNAENPGITPRCCVGIFDLINQNTTSEFLVRVSYLELYNEELKDLLKPSDVQLKIIDDKRLGPVVKGLHDEPVTSAESISALLAKGENNRSYGATDMNANSSRSHVIFKMMIESRPVTAGGRGGGRVTSGWGKGKKSVSTASLHLVDLAGSERQAKTNATGSRLKEGININRSLTCLGIVINKLVEGGKGSHIPYRDSKLTRMLQSSLGGNARTAMVCAISPAERNREETLSTLQYASRAKKIVNCATKNVVPDKESTLVKMKAEMEEKNKRMEELEAQLLAAKTEQRVDESLVAEVEQAKQHAESLNSLVLMSQSAAMELRKKGDHKAAAAVQKKQMDVLMGRRRAQSVLAETNEILGEDLASKLSLTGRARAASVTDSEGGDSENASEDDAEGMVDVEQMWEEENKRMEDLMDEVSRQRENQMVMLKRMREVGVMMVLQWERSRGARAKSLRRAFTTWRGAHTVALKAEATGWKKKTVGLEREKQAIKRQSVLIESQKDEELRSLRASIDREVNDHREAERRLEGAEGQRDALEAEVEALRTSKEELQARHLDLAQRFDEVAAREQAQRRDLLKCESDRDALGNECAHVHDEVRERDARIVTLQGDLSGVKEALRGEREAHGVTMRELSIKASEAVEWSRNLSRSSEEVHGLAREVEAARAARDVGLREAAARAEAQAEELEAAREELVLCQQALSEAERGAERRLEDLTSTHNATVRALKDTIDALAARELDHEDQVQDGADRATSLRARVAALETETAELREALATKEGELRTAQDAGTERAHAMERLRRDREAEGQRHAREAEAAQQRLAQLEADARSTEAHLRRECDSATAEARQRAAAMDHERALRSEAEGELQRVKAELEDLAQRSERQAADLAEDKARLREMLDQSEAELRALREGSQKDLQSYQSEASDLRAELAAARDKHVELAAAHAKHGVAAEAHRQQVQDLENRAEARAAEAAAAEERRAELQGKCGALEAALEARDREMTDALGRCDALRVELSAEREKGNDLVKQVHSLQQQAVDAGRELARAQDDLSKATTEGAVVTAERDALRDQLAEAQGGAEGREREREATLQSQAARIAELEEQGKRGEEAAAAMETQLGQCRDDLEHERRKCEGMALDVERLQDSERLVGELNRRLDEERTTSEVREAARVAAEKQSALQQAARNAVQEQLDDMNDSFAAVITDKRRLEMETERQSRRVLALETELRDLQHQRELDKQAAAAEAGSGGAGASRDELAVEVHALRNQLMTLRRKMVETRVGGNGGDAGLATMSGGGTLRLAGVVDEDDAEAAAMSQTTAVGGSSGGGGLLHGDVDAGVYEAVVRRLREELGEETAARRDVQERLNQALERCSGVDALEDELSEAHAGVRRLTEDLRRAQGTSQGLRQKLVLLTHEKDRADREQGKVADAKASVEGEVKRMLKQMEIERARSERLADEVSRCEQAVAQTSVQKAQLESELVTLGEKHRAAERRIKALTTSSNEEVVTREGMQRDYEELRHVHEHAKAQLKQAQDDLADVSQKYAELSVRQAGLENELRAREGEAKAVTAQLRERAEAAEKRAAETKHRLAATEARVEQVRREVGDLAASRASKQLEHLRRELGAMGSQMEATENSKDAMSRSISDLKGQVRREREKGELYKTQIALLEDQLKVASEEIDVFRRTDVYKVAVKRDYDRIVRAEGAGATATHDPLRRYDASIAGWGSSGGGSGSGAGGGGLGLGFGGASSRAQHRSAAATSTRTMAQTIDLGTIRKQGQGRQHEEEGRDGRRSGGASPYSPLRMPTPFRDGTDSGAGPLDQSLGLGGLGASRRGGVATTIMDAAASTTAVFSTPGAHRTTLAPTHLEATATTTALVGDTDSAGRVSGGGGGMGMGSRTASKIMLGSERTSAHSPSPSPSPGLDSAVSREDMQAAKDLLLSGSTPGAY